MRSSARSIASRSPATRTSPTVTPPQSRVRPRLPAPRQLQPQLTASTQFRIAARVSLVRGPAPHAESRLSKPSPDFPPRSRTARGGVRARCSWRATVAADAAQTGNGAVDMYYRPRALARAAPQQIGDPRVAAMQPTRRWKETFGSGCARRYRLCWGGEGVLAGGVSRSKRPAGCPRAPASGSPGSMRVSEQPPKRTPSPPPNRDACAARD